MIIGLGSDLTDIRRIEKTLERFGGRGGGRPNLAQGGGLAGSADEVLKFAQDHSSGS